MSTTVTMPVFMRVGNRGIEQRIGYISVDLDTGALRPDHSGLESALVKMLDESPELQAIRQADQEAADEVRARMRQPEGDDT